jgi:hypothetical protein
MVASRRAAVACSKPKMMKVRVAVGVIIVVAILFATIRIVDSTIDNRRRANEDKSNETVVTGLSADIRTDSITEFIVEFGNVPYGSTATQTIRLRNITDKPLSLTEYQATCRCTWIELPRSPIAPKEYAEAEIFFDSRGEYGTVGNYIEIATSDERCRVAVWMSADVVN